MDKKYEIIAATLIVVMVVVVGALGFTFKSLLTSSASQLGQPAPAQVRAAL